MAWYRRRATVPASWENRRIFLAADNVVREAVVFINGQEAGHITWPDGRVEITDRVSAGEEFEVVLRVSVLPVALEEWAEKSAEEQRQLAAGVRVRGLCGDVFLESQPQGPRIVSILTQPSVRSRQLLLRVALDGLREGERYALAAEVGREGKAERRRPGKPFTVADLQDRLLTVAFDWPDPQLWTATDPSSTTYGCGSSPTEGVPWTSLRLFISASGSSGSRAGTFTSEDRSSRRPAC